MSSQSTMPRNELIEASAGTGKTYQLVSRMVEALHRGIPPERIVALTFSRAAAGEIFTRFVQRVGKEARDNPESATLLRKIIDSQYKTLTGTIDSFLMRLVQVMPLEMGISGEINIAEGFLSAAKKRETIVGILQSRDKAIKNVLKDSFAALSNGEAAKSFIAPFMMQTGIWQDRFLSRQDEMLWGANSAYWQEWMKSNPPVSIDAIRKEADNLVPLEKERGVATFIAKVRAWNCGALPNVPVKLRENEAAGKIIAGMINVCIYKALRDAREVFNLMSVFENFYSRNVRSRGWLSFADLPRLLKSLGTVNRAAIEYRMDAKIGYLALDEFQDTSREQWEAIKTFYNEASQSDGERGVFVVGDSKQAIYNWRNGDVSIFKALHDSGELELDNLSESFRYGANICEAINGIFCSAGIRQYTLQRWNCLSHKSSPSLKHSGFCKFATVEPHDAGGHYNFDDFIIPILDELGAVQPVKRGINTAILVRNGKFGEAICDALKEKGYPVVWLGKSPVLDTPVLHAFLAYVKLAGHPGDTRSYKHLLSSPIADALYPGRVPDAVEVSRDAMWRLTTRGLSRTMLDIKAKLPQDSFDEFSEMRFDDMNHAALEFELLMGPETPFAAFEDFLAEKTTKDVDDPGCIKVMTIHHSKGLTFDYTIVPLYEKDGLEKTGGFCITDAEDGWVLPKVNRNIANGTAELKRAYERIVGDSIYEEICVYYVAMTRSRVALSVLMQRPPKSKSDTQRFADFIRDGGMADKMIGDPSWYETIAAKEPEESAVSPRRLRSAKTANTPRKTFTRSLPTGSFIDGARASMFFESSTVREQAIKRGEMIHAEYEKIEWIAPEKASNDVEMALTRQEGDFELWRERAYEIFINGNWESGCIDRVVFNNRNGVIGATIYDYKTNAKRRDETEAQFLSRMEGTYRDQIASYRAAVSELAGIPRERIAAELLLLDISKRCKIM